MIVEVFSCSGGMAEGLRRAGLRVDLAFDRDTDACDSYERNLGERPVQVDARDLLRLAYRFDLSNVELLVADPPCTPWSRAGKRLGQEDERDMLAVTCFLIREIRPRAFLIANVPGLDDEPNWPIVQGTIGALSAYGYCVADFARLDAADYGVPQHRVRPFWYGHLAGPCIAWPDRTHGSPAECAAPVLPGVRGLTPWVTCRQALAHLASEDLGSPVRLRWRGSNGNRIASVPDAPARVVGTSTLSDGNILASPDAATRKPHRPGRKPRASHIDEPAHVLTTRDSSGDGATLLTGPNHRPSRADAPARALTRNTHGDGALLYDGHPPSRLDSPALTIPSSQPGNGGALLVHDRHPINRIDEPSYTVTTKGDGRGAQGARVLEWPWERPATTIQRDDRIPPPGHHDEFATRSMANAVKLSEKAASILQGFPDGRCRCERERWAREGSPLRGQTASTSTRATSGEGTSSPTTSSGSDTTAPSPLGSTSTTRTKTRPTTESTTSNCSHTTSTLDGTAVGESSTESPSSDARDAEASSLSRESTGTRTPDTSRDTSPAKSSRSETESDVCGRCGERRKAWHFAGKTKRARWSQLGQAMPPPLAEAVARSIARQMARTRGEAAE